MIGTSMKTKGGIATVVNAYKEAGFFESLKITYIPTHTDGSTLYKIFYASIALIRYIYHLFQSKYRIVHIHGASRGSFYRKSVFILFALLFGKKAVFHLHGSEFKIFYGTNSSLTGQRYIKWILNKCNTIIVLSSQWQVWMQDLVNANKIKVVHNTLPFENDCSVRSLSTKNNILFLGQVGERKGTHDLLKACAILITKIDIHVKIAGNGDVEKYKQISKEIGLENCVEFLGWIGAEKKKELLQECDVLTLPSYNEGLPMSILEALTNGIPVVSTNVGGIPDVLVNDKNGYLIEPGDIEALADRLFKILSNGEKHTNMSIYALKIMKENFSMGKTKFKLKQIYNKLY